ncbi:hypothetical protein [Leuconostoc carnosum]|uniref:hypothetical protein n=1 Tax=Leuconostoc carnosum TaxID=1252 RepID=UPI00167FEF2C|nr:hypothetical protein [Leuconostoc carnosum]
MGPLTLLFTFSVLMMSILIIGLILHNKYMIIGGVIGVIIQVSIIILWCYFWFPFYS